MEVELGEPPVEAAEANIADAEAFSPGQLKALLAAAAAGLTLEPQPLA